ncbi:helix-turn-helix transcriptional regulator [Arthrobacter sp. HY1533]|uniref:helix-turn-helix transcriptional regulator n=1 Tax=Arthrobacter sp. HY1533 TaxID=2970919 RepID=UPI0022B9FC38|nr:LuxR C-terminal-related transcriptional regulator [Arthrobacter sp. HY1533]
MSLAEYDYDGALAGRAPRLPGNHLVLSRPRLTDLLEAGAAAALCILRGPRNSGKSTALRQWAAATDRTLVWLHLTEDTGSVAQFWHQFQGACAAAFGTAPPLQEFPRAGPPPSHAIAAMIHGVPPFTLVIENFHWVQCPDVEAGLLRLLDHAPGLGIVLAARSALVVEGLQATSGVDLCVVGPESLRFDAAEAAAFHAGSTLAPVSAPLNERLHGSPALHGSARRASAQPRRQNVSLVEDIALKVAASLGREFSATSSEWLDDSMAGFVAATVSLQHFDLDLARIVAPGRDAEAMVRQLQEMGFLWSRDAHGTVVHGYPEIIRQSLDTVLAGEISARRTESLLAAAEAESAREEYLPAFSYAIASGNYKMASSLIVRSGLQLLFEANAEFAKALKSVPHVQIVKHPLLALALGLIHTVDSRTRLTGLEYFDLVLASSSVPGRTLPPEERLALNLAQTVALRLTGQFKQAAAMSRSCLKDHTELALADRDQLPLLESIALAHWGLSLIFAGDFAAATKALHRAVAAGGAAGGAAGSEQSVFFATSLLAYRYAIDGDLHLAAEYASSAQACMPDALTLELYHQTPLYAALAMVELGRLAPETAAGHLGKVLSEATTSEFWGRLRVIEAQIDLLRGHAGIASGRLELALANRKELPALNPLDAAVLGAVQSDLLLASGNASAAAALLGKNGGGRGTSAKLAQARLSLSMDRSEEVVGLLGAPLHRPTAVQSLDALVLLTAARLHLQAPPTLRADIERISGIAAALGNSWPLAMLPAKPLECLTSAWSQLGVPGPPEPATALIPASLSMVTLTAREASILATLATTGDRAAIARIHFVSLNTIKSQLRTLYRKLGAASREEALLVAHREHLLD